MGIRRAAQNAQPVFRYPRILGHTTTAVDMPKLMIEMFHISSK
jgi:hypothetical protein